MRIKQIFFLCISFFISVTSVADNYYLNHSLISHNTNGGVGIIQNPSGRFSDDGEFLVGVSFESPYKRLYARVQFMPWLETIVRYTEGTHRPYNPGSSQTWKDKGFDVKIKLLDESEYIPALAIGFNDFGGTGAYASEYLVGSKRFNNIDFSLGVATGKFGDRSNIINPFSLISDDYKVRGGGGDRGGGRLGLNNWFTGDAAIFAGLEYYTPIPNLTMKLEYDTSDYRDVQGKQYVFYQSDNLFKVDSKFNFALNYRLNMSTRDKADLAIGITRGNTFYANMAIHSNLNDLGREKYRAPKETINIPYLEPFESLNDDWQKYLTELIMWQLGNEGIVTNSLSFKGNELEAKVTSGRFRRTIDMIDLASRVLANNSPKNIDIITIVNVDLGLETLKVSIPRDVLVEQVAKGPLSEEYVEVRHDIGDDYALKVKNDYLFPNFYWQVTPHMTGTLQHQIKFYFYQLEALFHSEYSIKKGLVLTTDIGLDIVNNFDIYTWHVPDGELHHVRQDRRRYLTEGESGIRRMSLDYFFDVNQNISAKASFGLLEWMFGGIGGEVLYLPDHKRWGISLESYWLKQRDFNQRFTFQDYETVTAHLNYYYDLPFYNLRLKTSYGKYLGKDKGFLIDVSRRFETGSRVGAIVALTDCDAGCVGEGSFNKWIYFTLPMDLFASSTARNKSSYVWSPLTKDAGQKLQTNQLYDIKMDANDEMDSLRKKPWSIKKIFSGFSTIPMTRT